LPNKARVPWWGFVSAAAAPTVLSGACLHAAVGSGQALTGGRLADLTAAPGWWLTPTAMTVAGVAHVVTAAGLRPADITGRCLLAIGGALTVVSGWIPLLGRNGFWHTNVTHLALVTLCVWPALLTPQRRQIPAVLQRQFGESLAVALGALLLLYVTTRTDPLRAGSAYGLQQCLLMTAQSAAPLLILLGLRLNAPPQNGARSSTGSSPSGRADRSTGGRQDGPSRRDVWTTPTVHEASVDVADARVEESVRR